MPMHKRKPPKPPTWEEIARFYSQGNMVGPIQYDWENSMGTTGLPGSGTINLNPKAKQSLDDFLRYGPRSQQGMVLGSLGLSTLIHEALHNRQNPAPGLSNRDEIVQNDLGVRLIPDLLQRFFGVKMDSPWGRKYTDMVLRSLGSPGGH